MTALGEIIRIAGPVVAAVHLENPKLFDVVRVGKMGLIGEIIRLSGGVTTIQVYEDTTGLRIGEPVEDTKMPLVAHLGPGLLTKVFDGLQRPLDQIAVETGDYIHRGEYLQPLPTEKVWQVTPQVKLGDQVGPGDILGSFPETRTIAHRLIVPPGKGGRVAWIRDGGCTCAEPALVIESSENGRIKETELTLVQLWPVRKPRPYRTKLDPAAPLVTGTRIIDTFFPVARGGTAIIPGGFGTGKTVMEHSLARWARADVVVYVGCGERGNEMTEVLEEFPKLIDPRSGESIMERTVLIANTSNMPVAAREASIYLGVTIAEYYRDMGYDVLMLADSTSRWGEALREISGRLEEMPGEEGYPAYLGARISEFYERSGRILCLGERDSQSSGEPRTGSLTIVGAVSPPGGDFSEPITQNSMRVVGTFWALDYELSRRRHFPSINWSSSYSLYQFNQWYQEHVADDWPALVSEAMKLLQREIELQEIVRLVGPDALSDAEKIILESARMIREDYLQQSAFHPQDRCCSPGKAYWMLKTILEFYTRALGAIKAGKSPEDVSALPVQRKIAQMREWPEETAQESCLVLMEELDKEFQSLGGREI